MEKMDVQEAVGRVQEEIRENVGLADAQLQAWLANPNQGFVDRVLHKLVSRKLIVFTTATALMWYGLNPETWGMIAMCYIGGQSAIDMVNAWKWGK
jgi:hypothetical protein